MQNKYPLLFSPITIGNLTFRNRMFAVPIDFPHVGGGSDPTPQTIEFFANRARGGAAQVTIGGCLIDKSFAFNPPPVYSLDDPENFFTYKELALAIKENGAVASMELVAGMPRLKAASENPMELIMQGIAVAAMEVSEMDELADKYAKAAAYAKRAGFDMALLHFGHGGLLTQFISPLTNKRTDEYGGSASRRAAFPKMIIERVRDAVGPDFPIELRISTTEMLPGGISIEDSIVMLKQVEKLINIAHCSVGLHEVPSLCARLHPSTYFEQGCNLFAAEAVKKELSIPVLTLGGYGNPELMEKVLEEGKADIIGINRSLMTDAQLPNKVRRGREREIRPCTRCLHCHAIVEEGHLECAVNPEAGREFRLGSLPMTKTPQNIMVIGGGVGGMQAAVTAAERGHKVTLYEKGSRLGGIINFTEQDCAKQALREFRDYLVNRVTDLGIELKLNTEVTPELARKEEPYAIIAALGAEPVIPDIKGIELATHVLDAYYAQEKLGENIVIIGGGMAGCEAALHYGRLGKKVTVVEMGDEISRDANRRILGSLVDFLDQYGVVIHKNTLCTAVEAGGVRCTTSGGEDMLLSADSVLYSVGMRRDPENAEQFRGISYDFIAVGDCVRPRKIMQAVHEGYFAARNID